MRSIASKFCFKIQLRRYYQAEYGEHEEREVERC